MILLKEQLQKDTIFNKKEAVNIAATACSSKKIFAELMKCFMSNEYRVSQRAAWCVSHTISINQQLIYPYIKTLIEQLLRTDVPDAVIRNSIRILLRINIPEHYHGEVMNACFLLAEKVESPIAIKAFSLSTLYKLYLIYPDIQQELQTIAEAKLNSESAAIKNVAAKIITSLHKAKAPRINNQSAKIKKHRSK